MSSLVVEKYVLRPFYKEIYQNNFHQGKVVSQMVFITYLSGGIAEILGTIGIGEPQPWPQLVENGSVSLLKRYIRIGRLRIQTQRFVRQSLKTKTHYVTFGELQKENDFFINFNSLLRILFTTF